MRAVADVRETKKEIEFLNTKGVLLQKHFVILHLLVEFAVEFFDIFIFNNVKSDLKIILCQPNKVVFKVKVLPL